MPGHELDGWGPRPHPSREICLQRKAFAERTCREWAEAQPQVWICSPDEPLDEPPAQLRGVPC